ncbi:MAG TPA: flagellar export protein FliJ [Burkholderiaceae bacterium]
MKRLQMLFTLLDREQKRRDDARAVVQGALRNVEAQQQQADGLASYRVEYCAKWSAKFQTAATIEILRSYHGFLARLDQAVAQQQQVVAHAQRQAELARQKLVEREIRVATVERLIQRRQALLAKIADRRDQKNLDEMAARRALPRELAGMA